MEPSPIQTMAVSAQSQTEPSPIQTMAVSDQKEPSPVQAMAESDQLILPELINISGIPTAEDLSLEELLADIYPEDLDFLAAPELSYDTPPVADLPELDTLCLQTEWDYINILEDSYALPALETIQDYQEF
jgi:hypothetical protein